MLEIKSFTTGTRSRLAIAFSLVAVAVSACGGGGGGGTPLGETPVNVTEVEPPVIGPPVVEPPVVEPPVIGPPVVDMPISAVRSVADLVGTVTVNYGFEGDADRFEDTVTFTSADLFTDSVDGALTLETQLDGGDGVLIDVNCAFFDDNPLPYFCATFVVDPATPFEVASDNFLFDLNGDLTQGSGDYNFCIYEIAGVVDLGTQIEACIIELFTDPDGDTLVAIDRSGINASAFASRGGLLHSGQENVADTLNYKTVSKQASGSVVTDQQLPENLVNTLMNSLQARLNQ